MVPVQYENGIVASNIFVGTGATNSTCIYNSQYLGNGTFPPPGNFYNNLCLGFSFPWGHITGSNWPGAVPAASNNATDSPAGGYGGSFTTFRARMKSRFSFQA